MTAADAVYRFAAALSALPGTLKVGESHSSAALANYAEAFCSENGLRDGIHRCAECGSIWVCPNHPIPGDTPKAEDQKA